MVRPGGHGAVSGPRAERGRGGEEASCLMPGFGLQVSDVWLAPGKPAVPECVLEVVADF